MGPPLPFREHVQIEVSERKIIVNLKLYVQAKCYLPPPLPRFLKNYFACQDFLMSLPRRYVSVNNG